MKIGHSTLSETLSEVTNRLSRDFGDQILESLLERCFSFRETAPSHTQTYSL